VGDPAKITLVRPDGSTIDASPEQADRLSILGYKPQTPIQNEQRLASEAASDYYTSTGEQLKTGLEGVASGASLGLTDYAFGDDDTKARAQYNPGWRLGGETLGALLPLVLSDGSSAAASGAEEAGLGRFAKAPTSLLSDASQALSVGKEGSFTNAISRGAVEGGLYGGIQAADHAYLDGDPLTAETILHGAGWGAIAGGLFSGALHSSGKVAQSAEESINAERAAEEAKQAAVANAEAERTAVVEGNTAKMDAWQKSVAEAKANATPIKYGALEDLAGGDFGALKGEVNTLSAATKQAVTTAQAAVQDATTQLLEAASAKIQGPAQKGFISALEGAEANFKSMTDFVKQGELKLARAQMNRYADTVDKLGKTVGVDVSSVRKPVLEYLQTHTLARELDAFPTSVDGFARMNPAKLERVAAALDLAAKTKFAGSQNIQEAVGRLGKTLGLGEESLNIRNAWKAAKQVLGTEGKVPKIQLPARPVKAPIPPRPKSLADMLIPEDKHPSVVRRALGYAAGGKAYAAARTAGFGKVGSYAAYKATRDYVTYGGMELLKLRAGVLGEIRDAAANYLPRATQKAVSIGSRVEPLSRTLFGEEDKTTADQKQLAQNRAAEFAQMAPRVRDVMYQAVEPLGLTQPNLAPAIHTAAMAAFQYMQAKAPKDPGAVSGLKSIWKPSAIDAVLFSKRYAVFQNPIGEAKGMLTTGEFDPIKVEALQEIAPNTWQDMRMALLKRVTEPAVNAKLTYQDQIGLSAMLGINLHTSMSPGFIASSQQLFVKANQITPTPTRAPGPSGGNPSTDSGATAAQRSTER
jgi:hypothetical protein